MDGLLVQEVLEVGLLPVEAVLLVSDVTDRFAGRLLDLVIIDFSGAPDFTGQNDLVCGGQRLTGDTGFRVLGEEEVDNRVGDTVAHLVRMALGNTF